MPENLSPEKEYETNVRKAYIFAMGHSLGVEQQLARKTAQSLVENFEDKTNLWVLVKGKGYFDLPTDLQRKVSSLGQRFLAGSGSESLRYAVGSFTLAILNEDTESGYFKNLHTWVDMWTDGESGRKFQELVATELG